MKSERPSRRSLSVPRAPRKVASRKSATAPASEAGDIPDSPSIEAIERRAYELFVARGGAPGDPVADWLQAERELAGR